MLDTTTKRRIDTARDILVGKIPDPKSQVEQITLALIYKFMDDMDAEAEELGGSRKFFADGFSNYGWAKLMHSGLGGHEMLNLYAEAISRMPENPGIPPLFRSIFKNAYLPYRDPETLRSFLKIIDEFSYDHSERLGDAFEYLLSVLGSQGDAGQFRTPRHIIDFIVEILAPQKSETVLDPACGTAGFLISSYKHILKNNLDQNGYSTLTPDEKGRMVENFNGYDISPDMVRLSLVNLYLHGFSDPHIYEYDTLTSQERWNEYADVILANPPFMSPKGGIRPHNRFSVQSKRSEVLFVDYIADHLTPAGRAGVIVPEGIIFQSQNAYKQLRKKLVEESLVAVISLPAGVFQPYSGVKTSVLIMDKGLSKKADTIAFFKVENDGFGLGAQRRPIEKNDLPLVLDEVKKYLDYIRVGVRSEEFLNNYGLVVKREKVAENGEYSLSGERYREGIVLNSDYPSYALADICNIINGSTPSRTNCSYWERGTIPWFTIEDIRENGRIIQTTKQHVSKHALNETSLKLLPKNTVLLCCTASVGEYAYTEIELTTNQQFNGLIIKSDFKDYLLPKYLYFISSKFKEELIRLSGKTSFNFVSVGTLKTIKIPLPPVEIQEEIVAEIESYQKIIDGARTVVENYRPRIPIDLTWPMKALGAIAEIEYGYTASALESGNTRFIRITDISEQGTLVANDPKYINYTNDLKKYLLKKGDILVARTGATYGKTMIFTEDEPAVFASYLIRIRFPDNLVDPYFYWVFSQSDKYWEQSKILVTGGGQPQFNGNTIKKITVPIPPINIQKNIVAEIEAEQVLVKTNRELIVRFEKKIEAVIDRTWSYE